jgi:hypothetical protein
LFASAISIPFSIALIVGFNPILPDTATKIISFSLFEQISSKPSEPDKVLIPSSLSLSFLFPMQTYLGLN